MKRMDQRRAEVKAPGRATVTPRACARGRSALVAEGHVVLRALAHAPDLFKEVVDVLRAGDEVDVGGVDDEEGRGRVVEEVVVVGAIDLGQVLLAQPSLLR